MLPRHLEHTLVALIPAPVALHVDLAGDTWQQRLVNETEPRHPLRPVVSIGRRAIPRLAELGLLIRIPRCSVMEREAYYLSAHGATLAFGIEARRLAELRTWLAEISTPEALRHVVVRDRAEGEA